MPDSASQRSVACQPTESTSTVGGGIDSHPRSSFGRASPATCSGDPRLGCWKGVSPTPCAIFRWTSRTCPHTRAIYERTVTLTHTQLTVTKAYNETEADRTNTDTDKRRHKQTQAPVHLVTAVCGRSRSINHPSRRHPHARQAGLLRRRTKVLGGSAAAATHPPKPCRPSQAAWPLASPDASPRNLMW